MRAFLTLLLAGGLIAADYRTPAGQTPPIPRPGAVSVLPGGRMLEPLGRQFATGPGPIGIAISPNGSRIATANTGPDESSLTMLQRDSNERYRVSHLAAPKEGTPEARGSNWRSVQRGITFAENDEVFVSEGALGRVRRLQVNDPSRSSILELNLGGERNSYAGGLAFDRSRRLLYVVDESNERVVILHAGQRQIVATVAVRPRPYAIALSSNGERLWVTTHGDPGAANAHSLCAIDLSVPEQPRVITCVPTGTPSGGDVLGGSSPSGVLATEDRVYVANAHNDSVSVFDAASLDRLDEISIRIPGLESLRGIMPAGLAFHPATGWLFVAESGINAVGIIDTAAGKLIGHLPAAWAPVALAVDGDTVFVANARGHGTGANANQMIRLRGESLRRGVVTLFPVPSPEDLPGLTARVLELNGFRPESGDPPGYPSELRHVVLIAKKSRSFDEILGDIKEAANGDVVGAPMLARLGRQGSAESSGGGFGSRGSLRRVDVTPNHHALAERGAFSDNFYADSEDGIGGQHWLTGAPPNPRTLSALLAAPGPGASDGPVPAVKPEEIPEAGILWQHLERHGVSYRVFAEGGAETPDQQRADDFIHLVEETYRKPGEDLPAFLYIRLPNDATANARPADGYPFSESFVADNDFALGRIVEYLSQTPWWESMAIFVTEDSADGGIDHIDSHRTVLLAISPYARRNYVSRSNTSFPGLLKTVFGILGVPPMNLFDATATDLSDCFTSDADFTPYKAQPIREELFVPERAEAR